MPFDCFSVQFSSFSRGGAKRDFLVSGTFHFFFAFGLKIEGAGYSKRPSYVTTFSHFYLGS